jgi:glycolate dehydrogenase iron-sulfur subunit
MQQQTSLNTALNAETDKLLGCIHCGLCLPACPTYMQLGDENDSPRGRIYLMRAVAEGRLDAASESFSRHIDLCLGCRACETACPAGVRYGFLLEAARETVLEVEREKNPSFQKRMLKFALRHIFPYPRRLNAVFTPLRWFRGNGLVKYAMNSGLIRKISSKADFALSLLMTTRPEMRTGPESAIVSSTNGSRPAALFTGCVMEGLFKHANDATKRVLAVNDCRLVDVSSQVCCGALHAHAGDLETARNLARINIDAFEPLLNSGIDVQNPLTIIINAAGCGALLKEYGELLKDDPRYSERARRFSERVRDVTEFLVQGEVRRGAVIDGHVTYDAPCHLYHAQRVMTAPQRLLATIPGLKYTPLEGMQDCCGGAGIYNLSEPEMSESLLADKIEKVKATGAEMLVTANPGCHMQLGAGVRMFQADCRVAHIIELLDESYQLAGYYQTEENTEQTK